jgi:predicted AAA+ superfamily ATPase
MRRYLQDHQTVSRWLDIFERLYAIFRLAPFGAPRLRAVKKARKHYHTDWSVVPDEAARFENLVASHLLKWVHFQFDSAGRELELRYFRDVDGREVDFVGPLPVDAGLTLRPAPLRPAATRPAPPGALPRRGRAPASHPLRRR